MIHRCNNHLLVNVLVFVISASSLKAEVCSGFQEKWFTTIDGCPLITKARALATGTDSTAIACTYSALLAKLTISQYDSAQYEALSPPIKRYSKFIENAQYMFDECVLTSELHKGNLQSICIKSFANKEDGSRWCQCQYDAIKKYMIPTSRYADFRDNNSGLYGLTYNCFETGNPVSINEIQADTEKIVLPAYSEGKVRNVNLTISEYSYSFLFDTGAERVLINKKIYKKLVMKNNVKDDMPKFGKFELATGKIVTLPLVVIKEFTIGDVILKDVKAAVQLDTTSSLILGMSAIGRFSSWTMTENPLEIILKKNKSESDNK